MTIQQRIETTGWERSAIIDVLHTLLIDEIAFQFNNNLLVFVSTDKYRFDTTSTRRV